MEDKKIDDIINMLDGFVADGGGHMNVAVDGADANTKSVETMNSNCRNSKMACMVPTMHEGLDEHLEE